MHQATNQRGRDQCSIKYKWDPIEGATFELAELVQEECVPNLTEDHEYGSCKKSQSKSSKILTTHELISVVGHVLDCTSRSLSFLQKKDFNNKVKCCHQEDILDNLEWGKGGSRYCLAKKRSLHPSTAYNFSSMLQPNLDCLRVIYGVSVLRTGNESYSQSLLRRFLGGGTSMSIETWEGKGLSSLGISYGLGNIYAWMSQLVPKGAIGTTSTTAAESQKAGHYFSGISDSHFKDYRSGECSPDNSVGQKSADLCPGLARSRDLASAANAESEINRGDIYSLHSDYNLENGKSLEADVSAPSTYSSRLHRDYYLNALACRSTAYDRGSWSTGSNEMFKGREKKCDDLVAGKNSNIQNCLPESAKVKTAFAKQEHAFAGAFAGIFVSLCLHPVDTVKTVVQSCRAEEKSLCFIGRSIVSERGLTGLYRGISSNIASSAPISAVYTFTYESVKGALLPLFPKEYYSVAHCLAGGCASIATSFIFTPSERIKQQLQVGSHYHNCWDALVGIIRIGGLPSLYAGWGAVLCRNIPHSVIKFYTYENLKQWMLSSVQHAGTGQPSTLQTLVCGGLAGSTAALFTTPFDVVKTRLQTQKPGSVCQYSGVFHALQEISTHEGLKGLYRGLTPRLLMYITQGALFFASYEFFKRLFNLNEPRLNGSLKEQYEKGKEDRLRQLDIPLRLPSSSASAASS